MYRFGAFRYCINKWWELSGQRDRDLLQHNTGSRHSIAQADKIITCRETYQVERPIRLRDITRSRWLKRERQPHRKHRDVFTHLNQFVLSGTYIANNMIRHGTRNCGRLITRNCGRLIKWRDISSGETYHERHLATFLQRASSLGRTSLPENEQESCSA